MQNLTIYYDEESDVAYIVLSDKEVASSKIVDDLRWIDLDAAGDIVCYQRFEASQRFGFLKRESIEKELAGTL